MGRDARATRRAAGRRTLTLSPSGERTVGGRRATNLPVTLLWVLGALSAFGPLSTDMYLPGLPSVAHDIGASPSLVQLTLSVSLIGLAAGQLLAGPISDAIGRRRPLLIGLIAYVISSIGCAASPSIGPLLTMRLVQGLAGACGIVIARAVVRDRAQGVAAARAYATLMLVGGLGPIVAPIAGGLLLHVTDWRGIFVVLAAIGGLLLAASVAFVPESLAVSERDRGGIAGVRRAMGLLRRDRCYVSHTAAAAFAFGTLMSYIAASPFVLERIYGLSPQAFSLVFAANGGGILLARQIATRRLRSEAPATIMRRSLAVQGAATAGVLAVITLGLGLVPLLVGLFVSAATIGAILPMATALAMDEQAERAGSASGVFGFTQFGLGAIVAPLMGVAGSATALPMAVTMPACSLLAMLALRLA